MLKKLMSGFPILRLGIEVHSDCLELSDIRELNQSEYPILIFVSNRLGKNKI